MTPDKSSLDAAGSRGRGRAGRGELQPQLSSELLDLDVERNRRLDPATVTVDAKGRELTQFVASYELEEGQRQMISFWAYSRHDAKVRMVMMRRSLRFEGIAADFDVADVEGR